MTLGTGRQNPLQGRACPQPRLPEGMWQTLGGRRGHKKRNSPPLAPRALPGLAAREAELGWDIGLRL